ncbi:hypothetical protein HII12_001280 [Brettanomyces bruxellensis]|uniref:DEBR0S4_13102g1_1 n=1 Tax=Dekkera bruxellensis TaxID=5007 RepID=A0A3F2Y6I1_DEKBR|nr:uncharacterized protein BRETT_001053 [Brettanomyces bruxellensis]KAF6014862.1 hypothetical protein HII12_001280 [Brettanomyces bruxellensis]QOU21331.1 hypothetical protein BRETT_001053 [Brettanomyces bruxellensis]VUG19208.1 DEBR0S4_13102g1_1 [Brettanomyces bruxellensis]
MEPPTKKVKRRRNNDPSKQLSEEEKKLHHIQSEHRRREQIRSTFDRLVEIVPDLTANEKRSELTVITKTTSYIEKLREQNKRLVDLAQKKGIPMEKSVIKS